ncbi:MAG: S-adenosylmethionine:tRNA ribosyltransferase-isomerase [Candidatus Magasanikbacteria bacterium]|nr:S-adenosylmethionine:tRNA ribosyltransferase-isomerase [Candidatus Magasanikbacteria bacterium]
MLASDFDYNLPSELIAQTPASPRDSSRLMIVDRKTLRQAQGKVEHKIFHDIAGYIKKGDLIVWNNSKVFKARLFGKLTDLNNNELFEHKKPIEIFLIRPMENEGVWKVLAKPGKHVKPGMRVRFATDFYCDVVVKEPSGEILVQFPHSASSLRGDSVEPGQATNAETVREKANKYGHIPVPPYIKDEPHELESYQTVYARHEGSVAAPTAGFHFTPELIQKLKNKGVEFAEITLHVGLGTFLPVKSERVEDHTMHSEWVELSEGNAEKINLAKKEGRRVVAVGTTTVRTLEGVALFKGFSPCEGGDRGGIFLAPCEHPPCSPLRRGETHVSPYKGDINLFITPGFEFKIVDAMITNFHLPKSTLLMLVSAFASSKLGYGVTQSAFAGDRKFMLECYQKAVKEKYRFYSFGDAMLIK